MSPTVVCKATMTEVLTCPRGCHLTGRCWWVSNPTKEPK